MPTDRMRVSVVVPAYNAGERLMQCVGSLMMQTYPAAEIIVVDDGSTDETASYVDTAAAAGRIVGMHIVHAGRSAARNAGIAVARGEVVAFVDADCVAEPDWLAHLVAEFTDEKVMGVSGRVVYGAYGYAPAYYERVVENPDASWPMSGNCAYRAEILRMVGGFDESFDRYEDKELALRVWHFGEIARAPRAVVFHQVTGQVWPDLAYADSSAAWVRLARRHALSRDRNNPAPMWGPVLMPRKYGALAKRVARLPWTLRACKSPDAHVRARAAWELRWIRFLLAERAAIWRAALRERVLIV